MRDDLWSTIYREAIAAGVRELDARNLASEVCQKAIDLIGDTIGGYARRSTCTSIEDKVHAAQHRHHEEMRRRWHCPVDEEEVSHAR